MKSTSQLTPRLQSAEAIFTSLKKKYGQYAPDFELKIKSEQIANLNKLIVEKNAVLLKHNYMTWDLQCDEVLGIRGDSLELSRKATETDADIIVFLGVKFMAETAKVLNPNKTVLIPSLKSGCSLASSINGEDVRKLKRMFPGIPVVAYVNTDADTKSEVDVCCASGNAAKVAKWAMKKWKTNQVIFLPDMFLAQNIAKQIGADIIFPDVDKDNPANYKFATDKPTFISWQGKCEVHEKFTPQDVKEIKKDFPGSYVLAHPECPPDVIKEVDFAGSTGEMIRKAQEPSIQHRPLAIFTECAMVEMLASSHKNIIQACAIQKRCPHMAQNSLESTIEALEKMQYQITVPEDIRAKAEVPIRRMISIK